MRRISLALALAGLIAVAPHAPSVAAPTLGPIYQHSDWLSSRVSGANLEGKVVLVDVFTFGCGNCQNVVPNLRALYKAHRENLAIVGVHTPETPYERVRENVRTSLASQGIVWPVAIDNDNALWNAYGVDAWPTQLFFDKHGRWRKTIVGDSQDADVNAEVNALLAER